ncbi:MAG: patatin-like phospholipase family protein [Eubacteriaceae bacterium]
MKTGIVCEGGGMRGIFTAGVLQAFMEADFWTDIIVGVSAGASNAASYISRQSGRGYRTYLDYAGDKRYASLSSFLKTGSYFGMDFIFGEIPEKLDPFDYEAFYTSPVQYFAGATNVDTGNIHWFEKKDIKTGCTALRASCSLPIFSPIVDVDGGHYLDGGIAAPIPYKKALDENCKRIIVILTQPRDYIKSSQKMKIIYRTALRKYPKMKKAIAHRHLVYNQSLEALRHLEKNGTAIVIAPSEQLALKRFEKDKDRLHQGFSIGVACGRKALHQYSSKIGNFQSILKTEASGK